MILRWGDNFRLGGQGRALWEGDNVSQGGFSLPSLADAWQSLEAFLVVATGGRVEKSWHCVNIGNNSRDYKCSPLSGSSCRQSTVNHLPNGTDHKYCRNSEGEMSPLIGGDHEGLTKTSVRQILKGCSCFCLSPYLLPVSTYKSGSSLGAEIITIRFHILSPSSFAWHRVDSQ